MNYLYAIVCYIMWGLFMFEKVPMDRLTYILALIFVLLSILFLNANFKD